jgi:prophage regulatory protein
MGQKGQPMSKTSQPETKLVRIIRLKDLAHQRGQSPSTILREVEAGRFPRPIKIGPRSKGWIEAEVAAHDERAIAERDAQLDA